MQDQKTKEPPFAEYWKYFGWSGLAQLSMGLVAVGKGIALAGFWIGLGIAVAGWL